MANKSDVSRDQWMLTGPLGKQGYDWWWHSFTAENAKTGQKKAFYVEFFTCNPDLAQEKPIIVWNQPGLQEKGIRPSYLMVNVGFWGEKHAQLHRFFAWKDVDVKKGVPYIISADDCMCCETYTEGSVSVTSEEAAAHPEWMSDAGTMSWKLYIDKQVAFHVGYGAGSLLRKLNAFEMFWHAEGMKTAYKGEINLNGEVWTVRPETCNGYADKNWGSNFTSPWVWLSSNQLTSRLTGRKLEDSVFDLGGGRPKIGPVALNRKLLGEFWYEGKNYEFNFSKFWTCSGTRFRCWETEEAIYWHVIQSTLRNKLDVKVKCMKKDMLLINYESPDGKKRHNRLWNGGTGKGILTLSRRNLLGKFHVIDEIEATGIGCEYGEYGD